MRVVGVALATVVGTAALAAVAGRADVIEDGYPYASQCPRAGVIDRVDRWKMYTCNCTSYVAWALAANHQRIDWFVAGAMNAWNWPHVAELRGLHVGAQPQPGAVAVWPKLTKFGHVAYVLRVHTDGTFDVAEYNFPGAGGVAYGFDVRTAVRSPRVTFVYVPKRV
jgi:surface antigen